MRAVRLTARQALMEQRNFWRSPEYALFTFALPLFLLLLLGAANGGSYLPGHIRQIKVLVPSILAFGVIAAAYANLGAKMAVLRHDGVLKRIRTTPLPSGAYLTGLIVSTVVTSLAIAGCTALAGWLAFGTAPRLNGVFLLALGLALGIICFAALGLAVSSLIKSAESASPITNASYLPIVMISGIFDPTIGIPRWMSGAAGALPIKALAEVLEDAYTPAAHAFPAVDLSILLAWAVAGSFFAAWRFRRQAALDTVRRPAEWLARYPDFELADPAAVTWSGGQIRGPRNLPVSIR